MDASTSTAGDANNNYYCDVFINHRGPDVKKTFASHLYRRLILHGLQVFLDHEELQVGEKLTPQIEKAIETASVHVAIFSPDYAGSRWCLNELLHMLKSRAHIVPVFYRVEPADLRWTRTQDTGVYARALCNLEKKRTYDGQLRYSSTVIKAWREALSNAADISGLELKAFNEDEGVLLEKVTECVLKNVKKTLLNVAKYPTGLAEKARDFEKTVLRKQHSGRAQVVGIAGMGGVGKTTLAKELFNRKRSDYMNSCFLFEVREKAKSSLPSLQRELLKGLVQLDLPIDNTAQGIEMLSKHLENIADPDKEPVKKPFLIVLDDVDDVDQVHSLLPMDLLLPEPDSLILITSRHKDVLVMSGVQESSIYQLTGLEEDHSKYLFCSYAFCQPHPPSEFDSLVHQFLEACNGLPLSLKVFGSLVYTKDRQFWEMQLKKLQQTPHKDIQSCLQISYDALDGDGKQVFLDMACFFIGEEKDIAIKIWDGSGWSGSLEFQTLQDKCLVEVDFENRISMHDQLRDLGRYLAKDSTLPRRLWRGAEDIDDLKKHSSEIFNVRGIKWWINNEEYHNKDDDEEDDIESSSQDDEEEDDLESSSQTNKFLQLPSKVKIRELQLLDINGDILSENFMGRVDSPNLTWLRWRQCHLSSLPRWIPMQNLRVLEVQGSELKTLWKGKSMIPLELRELRIFADLSEIPKSIKQLKHLERIEIIHPSDTVHKFHHLRLLKASVLSGLSNMRSLPDSFENLTNLEHVHLLGCNALERLPNLSRLRTINIKDCSELKELCFENLRSVEEIHINNLKLKSIRGSAEVTKLQKLHVINCSYLEELALQNMRPLEEIHIDKCVKLKSIRWPAKLQRVHVTNCSDLEELALENIRSLEEIHIHKCVKLKSIRGSAELRKLQKVHVNDCSDLEELALENIRSLEEIHIHNVKLKSILRGSAELTKLQRVHVSDCDDLEELAVEHWRSLEKIHISRCVKLKSIRGSAELTKIQRVHVSGCYDLEDLAVEHWRSLEEIHIDKCVKLKSICGSAELTKLQRVHVSDCSDLEELAGVEHMNSLKKLLVYGCVKLQSIPGLAQLTELILLYVNRCSQLEELPGVEHLRSLICLNVIECPKLQLDWGAVKQLRERRCLVII